MSSNSYSVNGSFPGRPGHYSPQPHPSNGAGTPGLATHFPYPTHYNPASHGYYSPFGTHPLMMYGGGPPPQGTPTETPKSSNAPSPTLASANGGKRKRKSTADKADSPSDQEAGGSGSDRPRATSQSAASAAAMAEMKKRTKTQRACDSCRSRKIRSVVIRTVACLFAHVAFLRCDILVDAEPPSCQHCKQYGFECTFFLPITETRFKKKKTEEAVDVDKDKDKEANLDTTSPLVETKRDPRVFGRSWRTAISQWLINSFSRPHNRGPPPPLASGDILADIRVL